MISHRRPPLVLFASFSGTGGVERMLVNLIRGFVERGHFVDLVLVRADSPHLEWLPPGVNVVRLKTNHTFMAVFALARYLRRNRPAALLAAKDRAGRVAVLARWAARVDTRILLRLGTHLSTAMEDKAVINRWLRYWPMRWLYPHVDQIVAVSQGVADDVAGIARVRQDRIRVIRNPVVTPELAALAKEPQAHPWLRPDEPPIILGAGRFTRQKDFPTLIRAYAQLCGETRCRLLILGDGGGRQQLEQLVRELGISESVALPGFQANPYPFMARACLFVLSSAWEGSPNVLTEAMALGTPVVSTDCPSGPRELLDEGRFGPLVPVGDVAALAEAMRATLADPLPADTLQQAVAKYNQAYSVAQYLDALARISHRKPQRSQRN